MSLLQLVSGLGSTIDCDFRRTQNQLLFVEFNLKRSRLNLYRTPEESLGGRTISRWSHHTRYSSSCCIWCPFMI
jgi:hypothetical protein